MKVNSPSWFAKTYAFECLWDCSEEARHVGCENVPLELPGAMERLQALAEDPFESELARAAAQARLGIA